MTRYADMLSYDQERVLKTDLDMSEDAQAASAAFGLQLVSGVAGSGKSLLVIYRARLLRRFFPHKRILALTHNRPLNRDLEARYRRLTGGDDMVEWRTFHGWCQAHWPAGEAVPRPIGERRRAPLIAQAWREHLADTAISERMLQEEIDWFKDRLLNARQDYLAADRTGRGFGLTEAMRHRVYDAIAAYRRAMAEQDLADWGDVPRRLWLALREGRADVERYDFVLVDEAQFFAPVWFEIMKLVLQPRGQLFIVADPTQGFLKRGQSWLASGETQAPWHWRRDAWGDAWYALGLNGPVPLSAAEPVAGLSRHEARAYAAWVASQGGPLAGAVLQHEYQWEIAARSGHLQGRVRVWEWCNNPFHPYPDFAPWPEVQTAPSLAPDQATSPESRSLRAFAAGHGVLRGASLYTQRCLRRASYRHPASPDDRFRIAGLRLVFPPA